MTLSFIVVDIFFYSFYHQIKSSKKIEKKSFFCKDLKHNSIFIELILITIEYTKFFEPKNV